MLANNKWEKDFKGKERNIEYNKNKNNMPKLLEYK